MRSKTAVNPAVGQKSLGQRFVRAVSLHWELYVLFIPVAIWYIIFHYAPMGGIVIAFKNFKILKGIWGSPWVGFANFQKFMESPAFQSVLGNTIIISMLDLVFSFPAPIIFALLVSEIQNSFTKRAVQTISYLPHFISWTIASSLFYMLLSPTSGPINGLIKTFGGTAVNFMGEPKYFRTIFVISSVWKNLGWGAIVYLAAITGVDQEMYEAATIDGAGRLRKIWSITIPSIMNVVVIMLILKVGSILNVSFEQVFTLANDATLSVGETIDYYVYRVGLYSTNNYAMGAAVGLFKSVIGFVLVIVTNTIANRISDGGGIW